MSLTPLDINAVRRSFDRAASSYDAHAVLQREVASRLLERLEYLRHEPLTILDLGSGTGSASRLLAASFPQARVIALDWSANMLQHLASADVVRPLCADMHALPLASRSIDLVFSNLAMEKARPITISRISGI